MRGGGPPAARIVSSSAGSSVAIGPTLAIRGSRQSSCPAKLAAFNWVSHVVAPAIEYLFATFCRFFFSHSSPVQPSTTFSPRIGETGHQRRGGRRGAAAGDRARGGLGNRHATFRIAGRRPWWLTRFDVPRIDDEVAARGQHGVDRTRRMPLGFQRAPQGLARRIYPGARRRTFFWVPQVLQFALTVVPLGVAVSFALMLGQTLPMEMRGPSTTIGSRGTAVSPAMSASPTTR